MKKRTISVFYPYREELLGSLSNATGLSISALEPLVTRAKEIKLGDFAFPVFSLAKERKAPPPALAAELAKGVKLPACFNKAEPVGPYLNLFLDRGKVAREVLKAVLFEKPKFSGDESPVVVEYSSPNIAKTLHVGHLRATVVGLSVDRIYRYLGYKVIGVNHIGDWGTQFGFVWAGCELWGKPKEASVDSLVEIYIRATTLKKAQEEGKVSEEDKKFPEITPMARDYFIRLEAGDESALSFWKWCLDVSLKYLKEQYKRLGVEFDHYTGESFYAPMLPRVEDEVRKSGILEDSRGALGVDLGKELGFVRIFTEDGRSLYITRDLATAIYRHENFTPSKILYVVSAQQSLYFRQLIEVLRRMKHPVSDAMVHIGFGFVPGMKTREGGAISLKGFLDEAHDRALTAYREEVERRPEGVNEDQVAEKVAIGATYFYFLSHSTTKDFQFSWKEALTFQGDSGPYVQYALARINSIEAKAAEAGIKVSKDFDASCLTDDLSWEIISLLIRYPETIEKAAQEYEPQLITSYVLDLSRAVSKSYRVLRVVGEEKGIAEARLSLFVACKKVLAEMFGLIGVPVIERM